MCSTNILESKLEGKWLIWNGSFLGLWHNAAPLWMTFVPGSARCSSAFCLFLFKRSISTSLVADIARVQISGVWGFWRAGNHVGALLQLYIVGHLGLQSFDRQQQNFYSQGFPSREGERHFGYSNTSKYIAKAIFISMTTRFLYALQVH